MNFDDTPAEATFRAEVRAWIDANAPMELKADLESAGFGSLEMKGVDAMAVSKAWQKKKADAGWACLHWPTEYGGRGATPIERVIWGQEEGPFGALGGVFILGHGMCGPTVMAFASEDQKRRYLPPLAAGEEIWCQLFSEPAGGSDLAGLRTRAEPAPDGSGDWIINGQKIWTSGAHYSDMAILVTRTDATVPKHKGLTMFFLSMKTPGIEIRPIKQANGQSGFNEVYFTDVRIPGAQRLGAVGDGWKVSLTTLMNERLSIGSGMSTGFPELFELCSRIETENGLAVDDPAVRSKLATWAVRTTGLKYTGFRALSALSRGETPGPENSIGMISTNYIKDSTDKRWDNDPGMNEWRAFMTKYMAGADLTDLSYVFAYSVSKTMLQVLKQCGTNFSRENVMAQATNLKDFENPMLLPGIKINTSPTNFHPIRAMRLMRWDGKTWVPFGDIIEGV